jgi:outer membrane protein TolC
MPPSDSAKRLSVTVVTLLTTCCMLACLCKSAQADETTITLHTMGSAPVDMAAPLSFMDSVKIALARSEALRSSQITVESAKLSDKDVWYRLFPKLNLSVIYNVPILKESKTATTYKESIALGFNTGPYDPLVAFLSQDASKSAIKLAEVGHVIAIEEMMGKIALGYIRIHSIDDEIICRKELVAELQSLERYTAKQLEAGTIATLDHKMARQKLLLAQLELERAIRKQNLVRREIKRLIGLNVQDNVTFETDNSSRELTTLSDIEKNTQPEAFAKNNLQLQAQALKVKLESYNIWLAWADHIPKFSFGFTTPDPMSNQGGNLPYYVTLGATIPIWSWGETSRGVEKAQLRARNEKLNEKLLLHKIEQSVDDLRTLIETAEESVAILATTSELEKLSALRKEIAFNSGNATYEALITARTEAIAKRMDTVKAQFELEEARVKLKILTGALVSDYLQVKYGEFEKN